MSTERFDCVGPDMAAEREERNQTDRLIEILNELPTLSPDEVLDRHLPKGVTFPDEYGLAEYKSQYRPPEHDLPGFGEEYETCGWQIPHVCEEHGHQHNIGRTCSRSVCPRCAPAWVAKRAVPITARIESAAKMMGDEGEAVYKHHAVASPPPEMMLDSSDWYESCMNKLKEWMEEIEMQGIIIPHPYSGENEDLDEFADVHDDDQGEWKKRLFEDRDWDDDVRDELQHRPHFHIIGATTWFPGGDQTDRMYNETRPFAGADHGWVFHRITGNRGRSSISLGEIDEVAKAVTYALSHCAIDTSGDRNQYLHQKTGWAYHAASGPEHEKNVAEARKQVHKQIGETLGIDWTQVGCHEWVPADETDHGDTDHSSSSSDDDGDSESSSSSSEESEEMASCHGGLESIHDADFIDEDWADEALHGEEALRLKEQWEASGGWDGWVRRGGDPPPRPE